MKARKIALSALILGFCSVAFGDQYVRYPTIYQGTLTSITAGAGLTGGTITTSGTIALSVPVTVARGGTGATSYTAGSIPFSDGTNLTQNNAKLFWDNTNFRLGIGINAPQGSLDVQGLFVVDSAVSLAAVGTSAVAIVRTAGGGTAPFDMAGSIVYRARVNSTAGRSSHIFFTGSPTAERMRIDENGNVGIGTSAAHSMLEVNGGAQLNTSTSRPACSSTLRGTLWVTESSAGVTDNYAVCLKAAADTYAWIQIVTGG